MTDQKQIHELILENFHNSVSFLVDFFETDGPDPVMLRQYVKLLAALRALPREAMDEVVKPVLTAQFKAFGLDPHSVRDRERGEQLSDIMAVGIQDATAIIKQVIESQGQPARSSLLIPGRGDRMANR